MAEYCYSVWLRHLSLAYRFGLCSRHPEVVAELGPGDSIGIGLAALISGSARYIGLDVVEHSTLEKNLSVFDRLVELFQRRVPIPCGEGFSSVKPELDSYDFPRAVLTDEHLKNVLHPDRLQKIRSSIVHFKDKGSVVEYIVPWSLKGSCEANSLDMIFSQAVMQYVDGFADAYRWMHGWLKPQGFISHQIDFRSHGTFKEWDGHWSCPDFVWRLMRGKRPYFITRATHGAHIKALKDAGFVVITDQKVVLPPTVVRGKLNQRFQGVDPEDLTVAGALIQARRG